MIYDQKEVASLETCMQPNHRALWRSSREEMENIKGECFRGILKLIKGGNVGFGPAVSHGEADHVELLTATAGSLQLSSVPETPPTPQAFPCIYFLLLLRHQAG